MLTTLPPQTASQCVALKPTNKHLTAGGVTLNITKTGINLTRNSFSPAGMNAHGKVVLRKTLRRKKVVDPMLRTKSRKSRTLKSASFLIPIAMEWSNRTVLKIIVNMRLPTSTDTTLKSASTIPQYYKSLTQILS